MNIETMIELSKLENIVGVKDATNDLFRPLLTKKLMNSDFCYLSGVLYIIIGRLLFSAIDL